MCLHYVYVAEFGFSFQLFPSKTYGMINPFSDKAVKIDATTLDQIFASDEEDETQEVSVLNVCTSTTMPFIFNDTESISNPPSECIH